MTDRELMQQALDALINAKGYIFYNVLDDKGNRYDTAIEALRARLAQPEPYAAQAAIVAQQTQGRMYVDPVTGDVGIGTVKPEPEVDVCCQEFDKCLRSCTPRGQWIAHVRCGCGDQIMPDDGAECGTCVTARNAVKGEWQGLTEDEIKHLWYEACQTNLELTSQLIVHLARNIEAKLKEKNSG